MEWKKNAGVKSFLSPGMTASTFHKFQLTGFPRGWSRSPALCHQRSEAVLLKKAGNLIPASDPRPKLTVLAAVGIPQRQLGSTHASFLEGQSFLQREEPFTVTSAFILSYVEYLPLNLQVPALRSLSAGASGPRYF